MSRAVLILANDAVRIKAHGWIAKAPWNTVVEFKPPKRTLDQNSLLHVLCTDVAGQVPWNGKLRNVEAWKDIFTAALLSSRNELDVVPGINGGFVLLGMHTSSMTKADMSELIELIYAFGAERGVTFTTDAPKPGSSTRDGEVSKASPMVAA